MDDVRLTLRVPRGVYDRLVEDAAERSMSVNWYIVDTLEEKFQLPSDTGHRCSFYNWRKLNSNPTTGSRSTDNGAVGNKPRKTD